MELAAVKKLSIALSAHFGDGDDPYQALASLTEELGEVAAEINKLQGTGAKATLEKSGSRAALEEELGDVVLSTFYLANALDVDLEAEMSAKYARLKKQFNLDI